jgi:NitT/TauT family transport system substrate-binding protein
MRAPIWRFWRSPLIAMGAVAGLLIAGCSGGGSGSGSSGPLEKTKLVVAAVPATDSAGLYIAQERGMFAAAGLQVQIKAAVSSADVIKAQQQGLYDISSGAYPSYIAADAHGANFRVLVAGSTMGPATQEIMVMPGSPINTVSDLKGKAIAINAPNNIGTVLVDSLLNDNAVNWRPTAPMGERVNLVPMPFPEMAAALKNKQVDAAWMPEPFITEDEEAIGAQPLADADQGAAESLPIAGYVVTQSWLDKYPRTAAAFRSVMEKAQAIAAQNQSEVQKAMTRFASVQPLSSNILATTGFPTATTAAPLQRVVSLMLQFNLLNQGYNAENFIAKLPR